jgi:hypothetical protein
MAEYVGAKVLPTVTNLPHAPPLAGPQLDLVEVADLGNDGVSGLA